MFVCYQFLSHAQCFGESIHPISHVVCGKVIDDGSVYKVQTHYCLHREVA